MIKTYDPKKVLISLGTHSVTGVAEDTFVSIEPSGDGVTKKTGCDGETVRSTDPDETAKLTLTLDQNSPTVAFLQSQYDRDRATCDGTFPVLVKDLRGGLIFSAADGWVVNSPAREFGKTSGDRTIEIDTGKASWKGEKTR